MRLEAGSGKLEAPSDAELRDRPRAAEALAEEQ